MDPSQQQRRQRLLLGAILVVLVAVAWLAQRNRPVREPRPASDYYTGAFHSKGGIWVTGDGRIVPPPPGYQAYKKPPGDQAHKKKAPPPKGTSTAV